MIVDANDLGQEVIGHSSDIKLSEEELKELCTAQLVKREVKHKQAHPDVAAINLALKNYDKDNWSNDPQMLELRKKEIELRERQIEQNEW